MRRAFIFTLAIALPLFITACNTIQGMGEDLSAGGRAVADTASKTKDAINNATR